MDTQQQGDPAGKKGRQEAGQQRRREYRTHGFKLHAEQCRSQGRTEQAHKHCAHARHDHDLPFLLMQPEQLCHHRRSGAAQLQGRAFPTGGAAEQVGNGRCQENGGAPP